jgi:hypothetical protein
MALPGRNVTGAWIALFSRGLPVLLVVLLAVACEPAPGTSDATVLDASGGDSSTDAGVSSALDGGARDSATAADAGLPDDALPAAAGDGGDATLTDAAGRPPNDTCPGAIDEHSWYPDFCDPDMSSNFVRHTVDMTEAQDDIRLPGGPDGYPEVFYAIDFHEHPTRERRLVVWLRSDHASDASPQFRFFEGCDGAEIVSDGGSLPIVSVSPAGGRIIVVVEAPPGTRGVDFSFELVQSTEWMSDAYPCSI